MKKMICLILSCVLFLTACSATGTSSATSPAPADSSKSEVSSAAASSESGTASAGEIPAFGEDLILMNPDFKNYDSYFRESGKLREFPDADGLYSVKDGAIYLSARYLGLPSEEDGSKDILFYDGHKVGAHKYTDLAIFFAEENGTDLYKLDTTTREVTLLYHGTRVIDEIDGDDRTIIFCCTDGWLYRTYALTGETREIFQAPLREYMIFNPWSRNQVEICYLVGEDILSQLPEKVSRCRADGYLVEEGDKYGAAFMLNCNTKELRGMDADEYYGRRAYIGSIF